MRRKCLILSLAPLLATCGPPDANKGDIVEAVKECGIQVWAVSATRDASQSKYDLWVRSDEPEIDNKIACYTKLLESRGLQPTMIGGSPGFDPRTDQGLLFARIAETCSLPSSSRLAGQEKHIVFYENSVANAGHRTCIVRELAKVGREREFIADRGAPPPPPKIDFGKGAL